MEQLKNLPAFVVIPSYVFFSDKLNPTQKMIYGYISSLANAKGYCFATNKYIAERFNVSVSTVSKTVTELVKNGYVDNQIIKGENKDVVERRLFLKMPTPIVKNDYTPIVKNDYTPIGEFYSDNNININNNNNKCSSKEEPEAIVNSKKKKETLTAGEKKLADDIMQRFNEKDNTRYRADSVEYIRNIKKIINKYSIEDIYDVVDFSFKTNNDKKYWRPKTLFLEVNFDRNYEFMINAGYKKEQDIKDNTLTSCYYVVVIPKKTILKYTTKPSPLPSIEIFTSEEDAQKFLKTL